MNTPNSDSIEQSAAALAAKWQNRANELLTAEEKHIQQQMKRLLTHPLDKVVLTRMIDQCFRSHDHERVADQVNHLLTEYGVPDFFSRVERLLIQMFMGMGRHFPNIAVPRMVEQMRTSSSRAIIPGESRPLHRHLEKRRAQGVRMNINHLGEAVLGEEESLRRLRTYIEDMKDPDVEYISVKISTLYSQISPMAFEHTVELLVERLSQLLRVAKENDFTRQNGQVVPKIVNMDMEEYRDIHITYEAFVRTLEKEEFKDYSAGIVLQAYLPDAYLMQQDLTQWAVKRVEAGGAPILLRIVKGANLEMELLESSHFNWPLATYDNKMDVDANYKRMVHYAMQPEHIRAVHLGVASHNLFELAYAHELGHALGVTGFFWFEMLEGMADHMRRTLQESVRDILLYAPVASKDQFINAIAYLIRRLDENTSPENFLRYAPYLTTRSHAWTFLKEQFEQSCRHMDAAPAAPNRTKDRNTETFDEKTGAFFTNRFTNEPDTDWSLRPNQKWAEAIRDKWMKSAADDPVRIPAVIDGNEIFEDRETRNVIDVATYNPDSGDAVTTAVYCLAGADDIRKAVATARQDPDGWRDKTNEQRHRILDRVCHELRKARGDLIGGLRPTGERCFPKATQRSQRQLILQSFTPSAPGFFTTWKMSAPGPGAWAW